MTDIYEGPGTGATAVLPPLSAPEWIAEPPPWSSSWLPPTAPGAAGGGGGYGMGGPQPGWVPPVPEPKRQGRSAVAIVVVAALLSAVVGLFIGSRLGHSTATPVAASTPAISGTGTIPSSGSTPSFGGGTGTGSVTTTPPATGAGAAPGDTATIAAKVTPGIVDINTRLAYQHAAAAGTGMVLTSTGEILTNNHVVDGATTISVTIPSTGKTYSATVVGTDPTEDVAVIQLKSASGLKTIPLGDSTTVAVGDAVVALGNAGGVGGAPSVVTGTVLAVNQSITASDNNGANPENLTGLIEDNAPIAAGDSGGPLANNNGDVIGMNTAASSGRRFNASATDAFAIPINHALSIAKQIESGQGSSTIQIGLPGFLGVGVDTTSTASGAVITSVASGTPAASAGLQAGDTITAVNGTPVADGNGLSIALAGHHPGDKVTLTWTTASGSSRTVTVILAAGPAN